VKITVRSIGMIRQIMGAAELELTLPGGATVRDLIVHLEKEKGEGFAPYAIEPEQSTAYAPLRVMVNGRDVLPGQYRETALEETDSVLIFTPIAGG
jgi:molybdopterin synthase sulfur carrier subunit